MDVLYIGFGGFLGAISRFLMSRAIGRYFMHFPLGTLMVNILGSFLLGFISYSIISGKEISPEIRDMVNIGFIGAFTTMSSFAFETTRLMDLGQLNLALLNVLGNVSLCLLAVFAGRMMASVLFR